MNQHHGVSRKTSSSPPPSHTILQRQNTSVTRSEHYRLTYELLISVVQLTAEFVTPAEKKDINYWNGKLKRICTHIDTTHRRTHTQAQARIRVDTRIDAHRSLTQAVGRTGRSSIGVYSRSQMTSHCNGNHSKTSLFLSP